LLEEVLRPLPDRRSDAVLRALVVAFLPASAGCSTLVESQSAFFTPGASSPFFVGPGSGQVLLADVDRDGHLDLLARHLLQNCVTVCHGDGKGGLAPAEKHPLRLDYQPGAMTLGDVDVDGILDVVIARKDGEHEKVDVLLGDGHGGFERSAGSPFASSASTTGYKPSILLADVDEDGRLDVVTANGRRNSIEILRGDGRGGFAPGPVVSLEPGQDLRTFALGDVDGDGHLDVVTASSPAPDRGRGRVATKLGDGRGSFTDLPGSSSTVPPPPALKALADVNGDQRPDVVLAHAHGRSLSVLWNDGTGSFTPAPGSPLDLEMEAFDVVVADVDGDEAPDLVVATVDGDAARFESRVVVLLGDDRSFAPAPGSPFRACPGAYDLTVGDLNEDGRLDVATSSFESDAITLLLGRSPPPQR
jgi:hypothetical protein